MRSVSKLGLLAMAALVGLAALPAAAADRVSPGKGTRPAKSYVEWRASTGLRPLPLPPSVTTMPIPSPDAAFDLDVLTNPTHKLYSEYVDSPDETIASRCTLVPKITSFVPAVGWTRLFTKRFDMTTASNETLGITLAGQYNIDQDFVGNYDGVYLLCTINPVDRYGQVDESKVAFCATAQYFPNLLAQIPLTSQLISTSLHTFVTRPPDWLDTPGTDVEMRVGIGTATGMATEACFITLSVEY